MQLKLGRGLPQGGALQDSVQVSMLLCSLNLRFMGELDISGWIAPLTNLRWLSAAARHITVSSSVGHLKQLRTLHVRFPLTTSCAPS